MSVNTKQSEVHLLSMDFKTPSLNIESKAEQIFLISTLNTLKKDFVHTGKLHFEKELKKKETEQEKFSSCSASAFGEVEVSFKVNLTEDFLIEIDF